MTVPRFWAHLTAQDFAALPRDEVVALLPVGAIEQHGPHLPLAVDTAILDGLIAATLPLLPADLPVLVLPTLPVGKSNEHLAYPGTLTLSAATLMALWTDVGASVAAAGVRRLVILNSHGGQIAPMDIVARDLRIAHKMIVVAANWFAMGLPDGLLTPEEERHGIHAGELETSMMLALHPDLVRMDRARDFQPANAQLARDNRHLGLTPAGRIGWMMQDIHPAGAAGNAARASVDTGRRAIDHAARQIATLLEEVHRLPLSFLEAPADPEAGA